MSPTLLLALSLAPLLAMAVEHQLGRRRGLALYDGRELAANLGIFAGMRLSKLALAGYAAGIYAFVGQYAPLSLGEGPAVALATFFVADFAYYGYHRLNHEVGALWAIHEVHHSSPWMNLSTAMRLNWLGPLIGPWFFAPLVLLGFPARYVAGSLALNLLAQLWVHTTLIGRLPRLEGWLNTPEAHRVHHASNEACLDKNYGGVLMIWDRLFGTWATPPEDEPLRYGVTTGFKGHNPVKLVLGAPLAWAQGRLDSRG